MAAVTTSYGFYFAQPWWLLAALLAVPLAAWAWRNLGALGRPRQVAAIALRTLVVLGLAAVLGRPMLSSKSEQLTLIAVLDRSQSVPEGLQQASVAFVTTAAAQNKKPQDLLAVIDVAEAANIGRLPSTDTDIRKRNTSLTGLETRLSAGVELAMAIAPPSTATRILLVSDGNETAGDLRETARVAAANGIPIDVLPLQYRYDHEVVFRNLAAPVKARVGQTIPIRFVLNSTAQASGQLLLSLNGKPVKLDPNSANVGVAVDLQPGTNVKTISLPVGASGVLEFGFVGSATATVRILPPTVTCTWLTSAVILSHDASPGHAALMTQSPLAVSARLLPVQNSVGSAGSTTTVTR